MNNLVLNNRGVQLDWLGESANLIRSTADWIALAARRLLFAQACCDDDTGEDYGIQASCEVEIGLKCNAWFTTACRIETMDTPSDPKQAILTTNLQLTGTNVLSPLGMVVDTPSYTDSMSGDLGSKKIEGEFKFNVSGFDIAKNRVRACLKNKGVVLFFCDNNGCVWQVGHVDDPGYFESFNATMDKDNNKYEVSVKASGCMPVYKYTGVMPV